MSLAVLCARVLARVSAAAVALVLLAGCGGGEGIGGLGGGSDPEPAAEAFQKAWTAGRCQQAMKYVATPDDSWLASCKDAVSFALACEKVPGAGDPRSGDCGPDTRITVRSAEASKVAYDGDTAIVSVVVAYTVGEHTRRERTRKVELRELDGEWKVTRAG